MTQICVICVNLRLNFSCHKLQSGRFLQTRHTTGNRHQTISGTITEIDADKKEIRIKDQQSQQPVTIAISKDSSMRRLTPEMVTALTPAPGKGSAMIIAD